MPPFVVGATRGGARDGLALLDDDERRRVIEVLRSIVYEDMFGTDSQELPAGACVRCGSISIVRRGHMESGNQRWYCKDCKCMFTANVGRVLGMSKLPVETWMTYMEAFVDQLPLHDCMDKCGVGLRTAWFMRRRIIECVQRYNPSFNAVAGDRFEIDETYFRDSYRGYRKGAMPRPARKSNSKASKRGLSKQQVCVVTGINDTGASFLVVSGRGMLGKERACKTLNGRIGRVRPRRNRQGRGLPSCPRTPRRDIGAHGRDRARHQPHQQPARPAQGLDARVQGRVREVPPVLPRMVPVGRGVQERPRRAVGHHRTPAPQRRVPAHAQHVRAHAYARVMTDSISLINRMDYDVATTRLEDNPMSVPTTTMRINPELKDEANKVLSELGLSLSGAVTIFLKAVVREQGLPIDMSIRSDKTDESNR